MADEQGAIPEALERLFDQAFTDGIAAGKSGDESILAGSSGAYARSALAIVAADRLTDTGENVQALIDRVESLRDERNFPAHLLAVTDDLLALAAALATHKTADAGAMRESDGQDRKFAFRDGQFVNRVSGEPIPHDEPIIIFRARDRHAIPVLREYLSMATDDHHRQAIRERLADFAAYRDQHPERMKEPGITRHIALAAAPTPDAAASDAAEGKYLVWSNEHEAWWGVDHRGYTRFIDRAGRYARAEALKIAGTRDGGWHVRKGNPAEIAMLEQDAIDQYAAITASQALTTQGGAEG